jgi:hypothetical protein
MKEKRRRIQSAAVIVSFTLNLSPRSFPVHRYFLARVFASIRAKYARSERHRSQFTTLDQTALKSRPSHLLDAANLSILNTNM